MQTMLRSTLRAALMTVGFVGLGGPALACTDEPTVGTICVFAFDWCPRNYIPADGRQLSVQQYSILFSLLSNTYGGDNATVFNIPDLRGRVVVGQGTGTGLQPVAFAQKLGQQSVILTPAQTPVAPHTHPAVFTATTGSQAVAIPASTPNGATVSVNTATVNGTSPATAPVANGSTVYLANAGNFAGGVNQLKGLYTTTAPGSGNTASIPVTGNPALNFNVTTVNGGTVTVGTTSVPAIAAVPTQPPSLGLTACIAAFGLYPDRP
jgi:microcystin-dependent protein